MLLQISIFAFVNFKRVKLNINNMSQVVDIRELNARIEQKSAFIDVLTMGMDKVIVGQKHLVESLLIGLLSDGHVLLEGVPGLAKTLAIKTLAQLVDSKYSRIQFTPDLLPAEYTKVPLSQRSLYRNLPRSLPHPVPAV